MGWRKLHFPAHGGEQFLLKGMGCEAVLEDVAGRASRERLQNI